MSDYSDTGLGSQIELGNTILSTESFREFRSEPITDESVVGVVLAGGEGTRLAPLTTRCAKPAVPFGARHRIIDFALSNLTNSGIRSTHVLVQHNARSVREHLRAAWHSIPRDGFISVVHPTDRLFRGTADAVRQSVERLQIEPAGLVLVFGADHVYRMDVRQMIEFHRSRNADVTVAALPVPLEEAHAFGVIGCAADGRIESFQEKPANPCPMPGEPTRAFASMGNYVFDASVLLQALQDPDGCDDVDFGKDVLPRLLRQGRRVYAYDFTANDVPGVRGYESRGYWRDVGTLDAYFAASMDTLGPAPAIDLARPEWPIRMAARQWPAARLVRTELRQSQVAAGALVRDAAVRNSIVRRAAVVEDGAELEACIVLDNCKIGKGARLRRVILDRGAVVAPNVCIGFDPVEDAQRWTVTPSGITIVSDT